MNVFEKETIMRNLVTLEKCLNLNDQFKKLSVQRRSFSQRMVDDIMKRDSPALDYCMRLLYRGPSGFTQFIDILIETKQNSIVDLLLNIT